MTPRDSFALSESQSTHISIGEKRGLADPMPSISRVIEARPRAFFGAKAIVRARAVYNRHQKT